MRSGRDVLDRAPWALPLLALVAAVVMLIVLGTIGGNLPPFVPTPVPLPTSVQPAVQALAAATPPAINYSFYDWRNTDFQNLHPEAGPIGSLHVLPWKAIHINDNQFDWRAIDDYLAAAQNMTVTLDDGTIITKPVILEIVDNESAVPSGNVPIPYPPLTPDSPYSFFQDQTPSWVRQRIRKPIDPITWVKSLDPLQIGQLDNDTGSYVAVGRPGQSACGWPYIVFAPKYDNQFWLYAYKQMVYALGARYGNDPRLSAIIFGPGIDTEYGHATKAWFDCDLKTQFYRQSGLGESKYLSTVVLPGPLNDITDWYRDAFRTKPIYLQFTSEGKTRIDMMVADNHQPPVGLKQATLVEDNLNQWQNDDGGTIQLMMRYSMTHSIAWENARTYTGPYPRGLQVQYFTLLAGLTSFPTFFDFVGGWAVGMPAVETGMFDFQRKYLGRTLTTTDEIWIAMRETDFWPPSGGQLKFAGWRGDFTYGLYRLAGIANSQARIITTTGLLQPPYSLTYPITTSLYSLIARRTDMASGNPYMSFNADQRWQYWGRTPVTVASDGVWYDVTLKYVDKGNDPIAVEYMDVNGAMRARTIRKRDSGQWVTTTITLRDAYLHGQMPGGADLRVSAVPDSGGLDEIIHMVMIKAHAGTSPTPTPGSVPPTRTPVPPYEQRVIAGGPSYIDSKGMTWAPDQPYAKGSWGYVGGNTYTAPLDVKGIDDPGLYRTERWWPDRGSYRFDVPNGPYQVDLYFIETLRNGKGARFFDVLLQGIPVVQNLDIFSVVGFYQPLDLHYRTVVTDGQLRIDFITLKESAKVNAMRVTYVSPHLERTPAPTPIMTRPVPTATPQATPTATPTALPRSTPQPGSTPTLTVEQAISQLEERYRAIDEAVRQILLLLPQ